MIDFVLEMYCNTIKQTFTKIKSTILKNILAFGFWIIVNISCFIFVGWKSTECFIKYLDYPQATRVDIKDSYTIEQFPLITICVAESDLKPPGLRWNISHLDKCGIKG